MKPPLPATLRPTLHRLLVRPRLPPVEVLCIVALHHRMASSHGIIAWHHRIASSHSPSHCIMALHCIMAVHRRMASLNCIIALHRRIQYRIAPSRSPLKAWVHLSGWMLPPNDRMEPHHHTRNVHPSSWLCGTTPSHNKHCHSAICDSSTVILPSISRPARWFCGTTP